MFCHTSIHSRKRLLTIAQTEQPIQYVLLQRQRKKAEEDVSLTKAIMTLQYDVSPNEVCLFKWQIDHVPETERNFKP